MKPTVSLMDRTSGNYQVMITSLLLLLSAKLSESYDERMWHISSDVRPLPRSTMKNCDDYNDVIGWITYQMEINGKLKNFQKNLGILNESLNEKASLKNCCFYENRTMEIIINDINKISRANGNQDGEPLKPTGDMGKDLDNILPRMKQIVSKGFKSCCKNLQEFMKKLEEDLQKQLEDLKKKLESTTDNSKGKEDLEKKLKELQDHSNELKDRLEKLEKQLSEKENSESKCCAELDGKIKDLESQIKTAKNQADDKDKNLENKLKDFKDKQQDQETQMKDLKKIVENRVEKIKNLTLKCDTNCNPESGKNNNLSELESRFEKLENLILNISKNYDKSNSGSSNANVIVNIKVCEENAKTLQIIEQLLQNLINSKTQPNNNESCIQLNNYINDLNEQKKHIEEKLEKSKSCCKAIKKLKEKTERLKIELKNSVEKYEKHINESDSNYNKLKDHLNEKLAQLEALIKNLTQGNPSQSNTDLYEKLKAIQTEVAKSQETLKEIQNQLKKLSNPSKNQTETINKKYNDLTDELLKQQQKFDELQNKIVLRVEALENKIIQEHSNSNNANERLKRLENLYDRLRQDLDKAQKKFQVLNNLEQLGKDAQNRIVKLEEFVNKCRSKCEQLNKLDDLIDKIEDLEKLAKVTRRPQKPVSPTRKVKMTKTTRKKTTRNSWIGGIDYVTSKIDLNKTWHDEKVYNIIKPGRPPVNPNEGLNKNNNKKKYTS
ncbi:putative leucine-rich repeat-containing protein DDB_G0290503 [Drosophila bipectinata]|uniref:putative leucine-rich repeat-containing protein DDB_G0290503 n=1 Tax=Drosophila bipectinata TaxID=42026 RepID=UPI0038B3ACD5